ncbi:glycosyl hydrolase 108 family protein [Candidatus Enterovibrio escicola]|nr:glycosyl hydrolase 108 family protein [Candidatus Enterovibrio escacola]
MRIDTIEEITMRTYPTSRSIEQIVNEILEKEGHRSNDANDMGGDTTWEITEVTARNNGYTGPMSELTQSITCKIYTKQYISAPRFDDIHAVSSVLCEEVIDTGINMGQSTAAKFLQRWLNVYNNQQTLYPDLVVDGHIGIATVSSLKAFLKHRGIEGELVL